MVKAAAANIAVDLLREGRAFRNHAHLQKPTIHPSTNHMAKESTPTISITIETGDHFIIDPRDITADLILPDHSSDALQQLRKRFGEGTFIATHRGCVWVDPDSIIMASITNWISPRA